MTWDTCEYRIYDGSEECDQDLLVKDLYVQDGHLREMFSFCVYDDFGEIEVGDVIMLTGDGVVRVLKERGE